MRIATRACVTCILGLVVCLGSTEFIYAQKPELDQLRGRIDRIQKEIAGNESARTEAREELRETERAISDTSRKLRQLLLERGRASEDFRDLASRRLTATNNLRARERAAGAMLDALYRALPFIEDAETDPVYKPGAVAAVRRQILAAIKSAEQVNK